MQTFPIVAICGRPNVGKSTLFNLLVGKRVSIVDPTRGVTRDRISMLVHFSGQTCELIDTGGIGLEEESEFGEAIFHQVKLALAKASLILFMVDIKAGVTPLDLEIAEILRKGHNKQKIWLIANKLDTPNIEFEKQELYRLGFGNPICISAVHNIGIGELKERLEEFLLSLPMESQNFPQEQLKIAVVGRTNAGKSTFINSLAQEDRVIVSEIPGTTRDSVDVYFEKDGKVLIVIDTAGLKKRKNLRGNIDFYSQTRAQKAIRRADVVLFMVDAKENLSNIDKKIAEYIRSEHKPAIVTVNKWDLVKDKITPSQYEEYFSSYLPNLYYAPLSFITAKTGKNVASTIDLARNLFKQAHKRISTGELNRVVEEIVSQKSPRVRKGKQGKIFYATQVAITPPTFILFVNYPDLFSKGYKRYLFYQFQQKLGFSEIPVKIEFRKRKRSKLEK